MSANDVKAQLAEANARVGKARRAFTNGRPFEVESLAQTVDSACNNLVQLPAAQATALRPQLVALFDDIGHLTDGLRREHDALKHSLGEFAKRKRAQTSYRKSTHGGAARGGAARGGAARGGATRDGATRDGATRDGA